MEPTLRRTVEGGVADMVMRTDRGEQHSLNDALYDIYAFRGREYVGAVLESPNQFCGDRNCAHVRFIDCGRAWILIGKRRRSMKRS